MSETRTLEQASDQDAKPTLNLIELGRMFGDVDKANPLWGEMELTYLGETTTPSRCGRMDQACAYGNRPIMRIFDGDRILQPVSEDAIAT